MGILSNLFNKFKSNGVLTKPEAYKYRKIYNPETDEDDVQIAKAEYEFFNTSRGAEFGEDYLTQTDVYNLYKKDTWVYVIINAKAISVSALNIQLKKNTLKDNKIESEIITNHPILDVLNNPNPQDTKSLFLQGIVWSLELDGNAYIELVKNGKDIKEMYLLRPDQVELIPDVQKGVKGYRYNVNGKSNILKREDVLHIRYYNPSGALDGLAPFEAAKNMVETDSSAIEHMRFLILNRAVPDGMLVFPVGTKREDIERLKRMWESRHQGSKNAGKVGVMWNGMDFKQTSINPKDMEYINLRKMARDELFAVGNTMPVKHGVMDQTSYANANIQLKLYTMEAIVPLANTIIDFFNKFLIQPTYGKEFQLGVDYGKSLSTLDEEEQKQRIIRENFKAGIITLDEMRIDLGLPIATDEQRTELQSRPVQPASPFAFSTAETFGTGGTLSAPDTQKTLLFKDGKLTEAGIAHFVNKTKDMVTKPMNRMERIAETIFKLQLTLQATVKNKVLNSFGKTTKSTRIRFLKAPEGKVDDFIKWLNNELNNIIKNSKDLNKDLNAVYRLAITGAKNTLGGAMERDVPFDVNSSKVTKWINETKFKFVDNINKTTTQKIRQTLIEGFEAGISESELAVKVSDAFGDVLKQSRPHTIARTEVAKASNYGFEQTLKATKTKQKTWIVLGDEKVRDSHQEMHMKTVNIDEDFEVPVIENGKEIGVDKMAYPLDERGSASNTINRSEE